MADIKCRICGGSIKMGVCELCWTKYSTDMLRRLEEHNRNTDALMLLQRNDVRILALALKYNDTNLWRIKSNQVEYL